MSFLSHLGLAFLVASNSASAEVSLVEGRYENLCVPVYSGGKGIGNFEAASGRYKGIAYSVDIAFPAGEIIKLFQKRMEKAGMVRYAEDGVGLGRWEAFNPKTGEWDACASPPARYEMSWVDSEKRTRAVVGLRYMGGGERRVKVSCIVGLFFDLRWIRDFDAKLKKEGRFEAFYRKLETYSGANGKIDLEKALQEHPADVDLEEFARAVGWHGWDPKDMNGRKGP